MLKVCCDHWGQRLAGDWLEVREPLASALLHGSSRYRESSMGCVAHAVIERWCEWGEQFSTKDFRNHDEEEQFCVSIGEVVVSSHSCSASGDRRLFLFAQRATTTLLLHVSAQVCFDGLNMIWLLLDLQRVRVLWFWKKCCLLGCADFYLLKPKLAKHSFGCWRVRRNCVGRRLTAANIVSISCCLSLSFAERGLVTC